LQLTDIVDALPEVYFEMRQQQKLRRLLVFQFLMENDLRMQYVEFIIAIAINLILLATYHHSNDFGQCFPWSQM
jgi:hypothetical protein